MVRKMLLLFFMVPGTRAQSWSRHQPPWDSALGSKEDKQALGASQRHRLAGQKSLPWGSAKQSPVIFFSRFPGFKTSSQTYWEFSLPRRSQEPEGQGTLPFQRFQAQEQPAPVLILSNTRSLASGRQVKAAQENMKWVGLEGPSQCSWQRWPGSSRRFLTFPFLGTGPILSSWNCHHFSELNNYRMAIFASFPEKGPSPISSSVPFQQEWEERARKDQMINLK